MQELHVKSLLPVPLDKYLIGSSSVPWGWGG